MKYIGIAAALLAASGCATVIRGTNDEVEFRSKPTEATVTVERITENDDNPVSCVTPCKLNLTRKRDFNVTFELEGYKGVIAKLSSLVSTAGGAGFVGNALFGGVVGAAVDAGTGAAQDLKPNPMTAELAPVDSDEKSVVLDEKGNPAPPPEYVDGDGEIVAAAEQINIVNGVKKPDAFAAETLLTEDMEEGAGDELSNQPENPSEN